MLKTILHFIWPIQRVLSRAIPWPESLPSRYFNASRNQAPTTPPFAQPSFSPSFAADRFDFNRDKNTQVEYMCRGDDLRGETTRVVY